MEIIHQLMNIVYQQGPAETTDYMILGYAILFVVLIVYLVSLYLRTRNLKRDVELLEEIEEREMGNQESMSKATMST